MHDTKKAVAHQLSCATAFGNFGMILECYPVYLVLTLDLLDQIIDGREVAACGEAQLAVSDFGRCLADLHAEGIDGVNAEGVDRRIQFEISGDDLRLDGAVAFVILDGMVVVIDGSRIVGMADDGQ